MKRAVWLLLTSYTGLAVAKAPQPHQIVILPPHIPQGESNNSCQGEHNFVIMTSSYSTVRQ